MIPVQGIGSVSVRLAADQDECVIDYGSDFHQSSAIVENEGPAHPRREPDAEHGSDLMQQSVQNRLPISSEVEDEYRATSAYFVHDAQHYVSKEVQPGKHNRRPEPFCSSEVWQTLIPTR